MEDRFTRGFVAGIVGGIAMNIWSLSSSYLIHFTKARFLDYSAAMLFGHKSTNLIELIIAQLTQLLFAAAMGVLFAYIIPAITSKNYLLKGWFYAIWIWFIVFSIGKLYKFSFLVTTSWKTVVSNFIGATIYGLILAQTLYWLDKRIKH